MSNFIFFDAESLQFSAAQIRALYPYLFLCLGIFLSTVMAGRQASFVALKALSGFFLLGFGAWLIYDLPFDALFVFGSSIELNSSVRIAGASIAVISFLVTFFMESSDRKPHREWPVLLLCSTLALTLLPACRDFLSFFVVMETAAVCGYILAALDTERTRSLEAGLKYLFVGAFSTALFLMGMALLYGVSASLDFSAVYSAVSTSVGEHRTLATVGAVLIICSLAVKVALVPFHMWAADVYQAAPSGAAAYLATATKVSVFIAMIWLCESAGLFTLEGSKNFLKVLGVLSILVGSMMAIVQTKLRRMLAYSSVASSGYVALAVGGGYMALESVNIYLMFYGIALVGAFALVSSFSKQLGQSFHDDVEIADLSKVGAMSKPLPIVLFAFVMLSLAGIPPLPGFLGKYLLIVDVWASGDHLGTLFILLGTLLGVAYYLRCLVPLCFTKESAGDLGVEAVGVKVSMASALFAVIILIVAFAAFLWVGQELYLGGAWSR